MKKWQQLVTFTTLQSMMDAKLSNKRTLPQVSKQCHLPYVFHKKRHPKYEQ